jgi:hypothetical protein
MRTIKLELDSRDNPSRRDVRGFEMLLRFGHSSMHRRSEDQPRQNASSRVASSYGCKLVGIFAAWGF